MDGAILMPMEQVKRSDAITKAEFHHRLREWIRTDEKQVGPISVHDRTSWVHVRDGGGLFIFHADTERDAVNQYLAVVDAHSDDLEWEIIPSKQKKMTAVAHGPNHERITSFYLYVA